MQIASIDGERSIKPSKVVVLAVVLILLLGTFVVERYTRNADLNRVAAAIKAGDYDEGWCGTYGSEFEHVRDVRLNRLKGVVELEARDDAAESIRKKFGSKVDVGTNGFWVLDGCWPGGFR